MDERQTDFLCLSEWSGEWVDGHGQVSQEVRGHGHSCPETRPHSPTGQLPGEGEALTFTWSCGDEVPGKGLGTLSPTNKRGVGAAPLQGLAGGAPELPLESGARPGLAWGVRSGGGCTSSPEEEREEPAERPAEVPGVPGAWTAGSEELLGTAGSSRRSPPAGWLEPSEDRLSTLRAGDGVAEGGSECERREAWRAVQTDEQVGATPNMVPSTDLRVASDTMSCLVQMEPSTATISTSPPISEPTQAKPSLKGKSENKLIN